MYSYSGIGSIERTLNEYIDENSENTVLAFGANTKLLNFTEKRKNKSGKYRINMVTLSFLQFSVFAFFFRFLLALDPQYNNIYSTTNCLQYLQSYNTYCTNRIKSCYTYNTNQNTLSVHNTYIILQ